MAQRIHCLLAAASLALAAGAALAQGRTVFR